MLFIGLLNFKASSCNTRSLSGCWDWIWSPP